MFVDIHAPKSSTPVSCLTGSRDDVGNRFGADPQPRQGPQQKSPAVHSPGEVCSLLLGSSVPVDD